MLDTETQEVMARRSTYTISDHSPCLSRGQVQDQTCSVDNSCAVPNSSLSLIASL